MIILTAFLIVALIIFIKEYIFESDEKKEVPTNRDYKIYLLEQNIIDCKPYLLDEAIMKYNKYLGRGINYFNYYNNLKDVVEFFIICNYRKNAYFFNRKSLDEFNWFLGLDIQLIVHTIKEFETDFLFIINEKDYYLLTYNHISQELIDIERKIK